MGRNATYLDPTPRDLTKASFFNSKPEARFIRSLTKGVPGTSMPAWGNVLSDDQIHAMFSYVQTAFIKEKPRPDKDHANIPDTNQTPATPDSIARGEATFLKRCTGCHGLKADGRGPNSLDIVPRPRNLRNRFFIAMLPDHRAMISILYGVQGTAMPSWIDYGLTVKDASDLLNYIRSLNKVPVPAAPAKTVAGTTAPTLTAGVR